MRPIGIYVPVVLDGGASAADGEVASAEVLVFPVVASLERPNAACGTEVSDIAATVSVAELGFPTERGVEVHRELPYILDEYEEAERKILGRSVALGMALEAFRAHWGHALDRSVLATGTLAPQMGLAVGEVRLAAEKLRAGCAKLLSEEAGRLLVLFPAANARCAVTRETVVALQAAYRDRAELRPVESLTDAIEAAFGIALRSVDDFSRFPRDLAEIEERRNHADSAPEAFFAACRTLHVDACSLVERSRGRAVLCYQALSTALFAMGKLERSRPEMMHDWYGQRMDAATLAARLRADLDELARTHRDSLPPEFLAERLNFQAAADGLRHLDFGGAIRTANEGIATPGLVAGYHRELRKLCATRGQLELRYALRHHALGSTREGDRCFADAESDLREVRRLAELYEVTVEDDRARARVYSGSLAVAQEVVRTVPHEADDLLHAHDRERWSALLGQFYDESAGDEPHQDARWALHWLYQSWVARGWYRRILDHWSRVRTFANPDQGKTGRTLVECIGERGPDHAVLPCNQPLAACVAEAAIACRDGRFLAEACAAFPDAAIQTRSLPLDTLALWWSLVAAPEGVAGDGAAMVRAWATGDTGAPGLKQPSIAAESSIVASWLDAMRVGYLAGNAVAAERARRLLLRWLGVPAPDPGAPVAWRFAGADAGRSCRIFVATRAADVPAACRRVLSVDGTVPGYFLRYDHHVSGRLINLDAMSDEIPLATLGIDGIGTTMADADAAASAVVALLGGKRHVAPEVLRVLESASHWCDHLAAHPALDEESNRLGRGLLDYIATGLAEAGPDRISDRFAEVVTELVACTREGGPLPYRSGFEEQRRRAAEADRAGCIRQLAGIALVDLRGRETLDPVAVYERFEAPVALFVEDHALGGLRYTVGTNPRIAARPTDLGDALRALAIAELAHGPPALGPEPVPGNENWGGRATVFGSPWNYGSRLAPEEVARLVGEHTSSR